jgi:hypothetical protein
MSMLEQIFWTLILSIVAASIAWTVTQEEIFAEMHAQCDKRSKSGRTLVERKFFYVFTCEYCFSHWVTLGLFVLTGFRLLIDDWRGWVIAFFVIPWIANQWMSLYRRLRVDVKHENVLAELAEKELEERR